LWTLIGEDTIQLAPHAGTRLIEMALPERGFGSTISSHLYAPSFHAPDGRLLALVELRGSRREASHVRGWVGDGRERNALALCMPNDYCAGGSSLTFRRPHVSIFSIVPSHRHLPLSRARIDNISRASLTLHGRPKTLLSRADALLKMGKVDSRPNFSIPPLGDDNTNNVRCLDPVWQGLLWRNENGAMHGILLIASLKFDCCPSHCITIIRQLRT